MSGRIKKEEFIDRVEIEESLKSILKLLTDIETKGKAIKISVEAANSFTKASDAAKKTADNIKKLKAAEIEMAAVEKQIINEFIANEKKRDAANKKTIDNIKKQESAVKSLDNQRNKALIAEQKEIQKNKELAGTYKKLNIDLQANIVKYKNLGVQNKQNTIEGKKLNAVIRQQQKELARINKTVPTTKKVFGGLVGSLKSLALSYLGITALIMGIIRLGKEIFNVTKKLDALDFAMSKVIKTQREQTQTQRWLYEISVNYGAEILSLTERYIKFRAAAIQSNISARETQKIFESLTKAAGVLGLKTDETAGIFLAIEQMLSKGKVTTEELRRQLGERLPGAFGIMADALNVTLPQLDKMLRSGEVLSAEVLPLFAEEVEKAFGIENVNKVDTLAAASARLATEWKKFIDEMEASKPFQAFINALAGSIERMKTAMSDSSEKVLDQLNNIDWGLKATINNFEELGKSARKQKLDKGFSATDAVINEYNARLKAAKEESERLLKVNQDLSASFQSSGETSNWYTRQLDNVTKKVGDNVDAQLEYIDSSNIYSDEAKSNIKKLILAHKEEGNVIEGVIKMALKGREDDIESQLNYIDNLAFLTEQEKTNAANKLSNIEQQKTINGLIDEYGDKLVDLEQKKKIGIIIDEKDISGAKKAFDVLKTLSSETAEYFKTTQGYTDDDTVKFVDYLNNNLTEYRKNNVELKKSYEDYQAEMNGLNRQKTGDENAELTRRYDLYSKHSDAIVLLEKSLFDIDNKGKSKSKKDDTLSILKANNKTELAERDKFQQEILLGQRKRAEESISDEFLLNEEYVRLDEENKQTLLELEIKLQEDVLALTTLTAKERAAETTKLYELQADLARDVTDTTIGEEERLLKETERVAKEKAQIALTSEAERSNIAIINLSKQANNDIYAINASIKNAEARKRKIEKIEEELTRKILEEQLKRLENEYAVMKASGNFTEAQLKTKLDQITTVELKISDSHAESSNKIAATDQEKRDALINASVQLTNELFNMYNSLADRRMEIADRELQNDLDLAGDSLEGKMAAENKYKKEKNKILKEQAIAEKAQAIFTISMELAKSIMGIWGTFGGFPPVAAALTAIVTGVAIAQQVATLAKPIPRYFEGGDVEVGKTMVIVGEDKGSKKGGSELITLPSGNSFLSPDTATLMDLPYGTHIDSHRDTQRILSNAVMNTAYGRIDMSKSEGYLKIIAQKETIVKENRIKRVTRKGFQGEYSC